MEEPPRKRCRTAQLKVTGPIGDYDLSDRLGFAMMFAYLWNCPVTALTKLSKAQEQMCEAIDQLVQTYTPDELDKFCWRHPTTSWFRWQKPELILLHPCSIDVCTEQLRRLSNDLRRPRSRRRQEQRWYTVKNVGGCMATVEKAFDKVTTQLVSMHGDGWHGISAPKQSGPVSHFALMNGTICCEGLRWMLQFAKHKNLGFGDLGFGMGQLLAMATISGFETTGIEYSSYFFSRAEVLFEQLKLPFRSQMLARGNILDWRPHQSSWFFFLNNERFTELSAEILYWAPTALCSGCYLGSLQPLPSTALKTRRAREGVIGDYYCNGKKTITLVGEVKNFSVISWNCSQNDNSKIGDSRESSTRVYKLYLYQIHDANQRADIVGVTFGTAGDACDAGDADTEMELPPLSS